MRQRKLLVGAEEISRTLSERDPDRTSIHIVPNLDVSGLEEAPVATYYLTRYIGAGHAMSSHAILDCRDVFKRGPGGLTIASKTSHKLM